MPTANALIVRFCATCRGDVSFEQPECLDGHGGDCDEWVCVRCSEAFVVGFAVAERIAASRATSHVA